ncbi:MAG TPA: hypothetical protein IGS40_18065 [Trichormus sp. M33_DOE_039]|nr:hypothetical protein [Trichormus sp. M33_DOE_039]
MEIPFIKDLLNELNTIENNSETENVSADVASENNQELQDNLNKGGNQVELNVNSNNIEIQNFGGICWEEDGRKICI